MSSRVSSGRKAPYVADPDDDVVTDGFVARVTDRVFDNPAMSGGLLVMGLTAMAIVSNAMFLQSARHPQPLFMTRPAQALIAPHVDPADVPLPRSRADRAGDAPAPAAMPPLPRVPPQERVDNAPPVVDRAVVTDLQRALAERGYYKGAVDGISGSRTRAAISAYQKAEGLPVTGQPSTVVLDHIRTASIPTRSPPAAPPVAPSVAAPVPEAPPAAPVAIAPVDPSPGQEDLIASVVESPSAPVAEAAPVAEVAPDPATIESARYAAVQHALNRIGYGPVVESGVVDRDTSDAIRRFELDNGLPITGLPEKRVVDRLISIGAMEAI